MHVLLWKISLQGRNVVAFSRNSTLRLYKCPIQPQRSRHSCLTAVISATMGRLQQSKIKLVRASLSRSSICSRMYMIGNGHIELLKSTVKSKLVYHILPYLNSNLILLWKEMFQPKLFLLQQCTRF